MAPLNTILPPGFLQTVSQQLEQAPQGLSEYDLLSQLRDQGFFPFWQQAPALPEELFRAHFLLYHALYLLRDDYLQKQHAVLQIEVLKIQMLPYQAGDEMLSSVDSLRSYYLDVTNLEQTPAEINEMIAAFWRRLSKVEQRSEALAELGLQDPVDDAAIRQAYRRKVMQHHPDRGNRRRDAEHENI